MFYMLQWPFAAFIFVNKMGAKKFRVLPPETGGTSYLPLPFASWLCGSPFGSAEAKSSTHSPDKTLTVDLKEDFFFHPAKTAQKNRDIRFHHCPSPWFCRFEAGLWWFSNHPSMPRCLYESELYWWPPFSQLGGFCRSGDLSSWVASDEATWAKPLGDPSRFFLGWLS